MPRKRNHRNDEVALQNAVKTLLANIRFASVDEPVSSIVITSSVPNEGKTTVSISLAKAIATSGRDVLLVETDMRRRSLGGMLGVHSRQGLYAVLAGDCTLEDAVADTDVPDMYFLDAEPNIPNPADILASHRFRRFVKEVNSRYDYVIFDTPPVGTFVDAAVIAAVADATILVVRERFVKRNELLGAFEQLQKAEANVIGTVVNGCAPASGDYYYAYYNDSGERVDVKSEQAMTSRVPAAKASPRPAGMRAQSARGVQAPRPATGGAAGMAPAAPTGRSGVIPPDTTAAMISSFRSGGVRTE